MQQQQMEGLSRLLKNKRAALITQIERLESTGLREPLANSTGELSNYDNHPADSASDTFERAKDIGLLDNERILLAKVDNALEKIATGAYGVCEQCGKQIPMDRLDAIPWANSCISCQQETDDIEKSLPRPIEEAILKPPFARSFLDNAKSEYAGFDGEDAIQAVTRYGSSDTPQDLPGTNDYKALFYHNDEHHGLVEIRRQGRSNNST